jgi:hypothetical protein
MREVFWTDPKKRINIKGTYIVGTIQCDRDIHPDLFTLRVLAVFDLQVIK